MDKKSKLGVLGAEYTEEREKKDELKFRYKTRSRIVTDAIKKYIKNTKGLRVLDYGSAEGLGLLELDKILPRNYYKGIEYSEELIRKSPRLPENISIEVGDVCNLNDDIKNKKYDVVVALALLEHLPDPQLCLQETKDVLKDEGIFIASSPSPLWDEISTRLGLLKDGQHEMDINKKVIADLAEKAGLEFVEYRRFMWAPVSFLPYLRIRVSPKIALRIDDIVRKLVVFNFLFVNQLFILKRKK